jgi:hypothetical protein
LGFQNAAAVIDHVDYLSTGAGSIDDIVVSAPEPDRSRPPNWTSCSTASPEAATLGFGFRR